MRNFLKEFIFLILFLAVIIMMIGILFYEFIPTKVTPESAKYSQSKNTENLISEIKNEQKSIDETSFKTYQLAKEDANSDTYEPDKEYEQGKNHPFYDYTSEVAKVNSSANSNESNVQSSVDQTSSVDKTVSTESVASTNSGTSTTSAVNSNTTSSTSTTPAVSTTTDSVTNTQPEVKNDPVSQPSNVSPEPSNSGQNVNNDSAPKNTNNLRDTSDSTKISK